MARRSNHRTPSSFFTSSSQLHLVSDDPETARGLFFLWFFGASGGGGIAISAFPNMYKRYQELQTLGSGDGDGESSFSSTLGEKSLGLPTWLVGYPEDVRVKDVEQVLSNPMSIETMVAQGPKENMWAQKGYLRLEAFEAAQQQQQATISPLAIRAVFDALGSTSSTIEPDLAQERLDMFRDQDDGLEELKKSVVLNKLRGWSAILALLLVLGLAAQVSIESFARGWFPEWPGNQNFPIGLVSPGIWTIPQYWI